jgi:4-amino-4-deoxy-L-arabinose transferase-like glycosyltransferase
VSLSEITDSQERILEYLALAAILILAAVLSCYRIAEPAWDDTHGAAPLDGFQGSILAEHGNVAQNYVKFGYIRTKLGQTTNHGWVEPSETFEYRFDHPPLLPLALSVSFRLFGIHEWSARLVPVICSMGILLLVFLLAGKLATRRAASLAPFFLVLTPIYAYYSKLPDYFILASFFSLLTFVFYLRWTERGTWGCYLGIYLSFVLGSLSDWVTYFVVPVILLHYLVFEYKRARNWWFVILFGLAPIALFAIHLGSAYLLGGEGVLKELLELFLFRSISAGSQQSRFAFTWWDFYAIGYIRSKLFLTPTILLLSIVGSITLVAGLFKKESSRQHAFVLALFLFGLIHNLFFSNLAFIHDYVMLFHLLPFFIIAATLGVEFIIEKVLMNRRTWGVPCVLVVCCCLALQSPSTLRRLHQVSVLPDIYLIGTRISALTDEIAKVMASFRLDYRMGFYADRPWSVVTDLDTLTRLWQADSRYSLYVFDSESAGGIDKNLKEYLVRNHPVETFYGYSFFDLRETGSDTILQNPQIEHPAEVNFDKLMFLGYNVEEVVQKKKEPSWLEKYLKGHAELLPEHRTFFRITYFWQCLEEMEEDYTLVTQFEGYHGKTYRINQSHQGVNGAYPTSMWQVGETIREEYQVEVPADYPPIRYALWVGVRDGEEDPEVMSDVEIEENRVRLGEVEVLPVEEPSPLTGEPRPQNSVEANINDEMVFLGYDFNDRNPKPGDQLKVTTYWQSLRKTERDYAIQVELRNGGYKVQEILNITPTRLWEEGRYYRGDAVIAINPHLFEGTYSLNLGLERDDGTATQIGLASLDIPCRRRHIIRRLGKANYGGSEILSPDEPLSLRFDLKDREALELVAGWTGKSEFEETRVEAYISKPNSHERYLGTWVIRSGRYTTTKRRIPRSLTDPGQNVIELRVPEVRERVHNIGWRGALDLLFPDLLQDSSLPYNGAIQIDFAQVSSRWEGDWNDYYDLAQVYAERGMQGEVARLYEEAMDEGLVPERVDEFALFKRAYRALGEERKVGGIEERIAERIAHKMNVNLEGKVEFLGHSLTEGEENDHGISLFFRCLEEMEEDYTLWVHGEVENESLLEGQRREAGYAVFDHLLSTSRWQVGEVYQDDEVRGLKAGRYHFTLGLWRPEDGSRLWGEDDPNAHIIDLGWVQVK